MDLEALSGWRPRKVVRVSGSRLRTFRSCPAKFALENFLYMPKKRDDNQNYAMMLGNAMHAAWQDYVIHKDLIRAKAILAISFDHDHPWPKKQSTYWRALDALEQVCALDYSNMPVVKVKVEGIEGLTNAIELPVCLEVPVPEYDMLVLYTGYVDAVVWNPDTEQFIVGDLKTTGMYENRFAPSYMYDTQIVGYTALVSALLNEGKFGVSMEAQYIGVSTSKTQPWQQTISKMVGAEEVALFIHEIHQFAAQVALFQGSNRFPRNSNECTNFGTCPHLGNKCEALTLREMQQQVDPLMREDSFMEEFPKPGEVLTSIRYDHKRL